MTVSPQLLEAHCNGIAEVMGSNPVQACDDSYPISQDNLSDVFVPCDTFHAMRAGRN